VDEADHNFWTKLPEHERDSQVEEYVSFAGHDAIKESALLQSPKRATTIHPRSHGAEEREGGFHDQSSHQLGGFFIVEADSKRDAVELARRLPAAQQEPCAIEVRPLAESPKELH
jgi:hypothetical protein